MEKAPGTMLPRAETIEIGVDPLLRALEQCNLWLEHCIVCPEHCIVPLEQCNHLLGSVLDIEMLNLLAEKASRKIELQEKAAYNPIAMSSSKGAKSEKEDG